MAVKLFAAMTLAYFRTLQEEGLSKEEAMELTKEYIWVMISKQS